MALLVVPVPLAADEALLPVQELLAVLPGVRAPQPDLQRGPRRLRVTPGDPAPIARRLEAPLVPDLRV